MTDSPDPADCIQIRTNSDMYFTRDMRPPVSDFVDLYVQKREAVREALPAADWQNLRDAVEKLLDFKPAKLPASYQRDELDDAGDDGFWTCHASMVAIIAEELGLEKRR